MARNYRNVHSPADAPMPEPERHRLEFVSSPDSAALSEVVSLLAQTLNDFRAWAAENQRYQAEQRGAMARVQIPTPHVQIEAAKAPDVDVQVEAPPAADVTVNVPETRLQLMPVLGDWKEIEVVRGSDGLISGFRKIK